jgi:hypothetical protein
MSAAGLGREASSAPSQTHPKAAVASAFSKAPAYSFGRGRRTDFASTDTGNITFFYEFTFI